MKLRRGIKNIIFGLFSQVIILALGMIVPRLFIVNYGSEVNGLFSTISQIFAYVALLEAGVGVATVQALYKPLAEQKTNDISRILSATHSYYKRISLYYVICVIVLALTYPFLVKSGIDKLSIALILLLQGFSGVINFYFQATLRQLMIAEGRNYVITNISLIISISTSFIKILLIFVGANILLIQFAFFVVSVLQVLLYQLYFKKKYKWVNFAVEPNFAALSQKSSFLVHQVSGLIFSSTDLLVLSIFCDFKVASIYAIYNLIMSSLNALASTVNNSLSFILGLTYHEDKKIYMRLHDAYNTYYVAFIFSIFSICYLLFLPFINLYTHGADINYVDAYLPFLFCLIQILSCTRMVSSNLISISGHVKQTRIRSMIEACINIIVSVSLVNIMGIYGVLIGTIVALLYRTNDIIIYSDRRILKRSTFKSYKTIIINGLLFAFLVFINDNLNLMFESYFEFLICGIVISLIIIPIYFIINSVFNKNDYNFILSIVKPHIKKYFAKYNISV